MLISAIQTEPLLGDVQANLDACVPLVAKAADSGAKVIVLPEFFTTGMAYLPAMRTGTRPVAEITDWLVERCAAHDVSVGGSFLGRDEGGHARNAFVLADREGVLGRHDKDLPTMWENAFYAGGTDPGVLRLRDGTTVGVALCWELMRSQTVHRLRGVDVVLAGSAWWSVPPWHPRALTRSWEADNARTAHASVRSFAGLVGAPVVHASLSGTFDSPMLGLPLRYSGFYEGPTGIYDATGTTLIERSAAEGPGVVVADVALGGVPPNEEPPGDFWLRPRGPLPAFAWAFQRYAGRREYARHAEGEADVQR